MFEGGGGGGTLQRIDIIWHFSRIKKLVKPVTFAKKKEDIREVLRILKAREADA